ncbi:hypothetical protein [Actinoallomurus acaciae]|uniref:DUF3558 domain-containing protein n=1 Tax=Actinoallomurus acaciae TaxID=502577 RepID=A0ABV5YK88_9ACTN
MPPGGPPGPFPPAPSARRPPIALIVIAALVVVVGGGGAAYLATISSGAYPKAIWACALIPVADSAALVPHGLPKGSPPANNESTCTWSNLVAVNAGLEKTTANLTVHARRQGRGLLSSAESGAHQELVAETDGSSGVRSAGTPLSGYGDEAARVPKAFGGEFDSIVFRDSNLVVEVAVELDDHPGAQTSEAWNRTQRAASLAARQLRTLRG